MKPARWIKPANFAEFQVPPEKLYRTADITRLPGRSTEDIPPSQRIIGQERARATLRLSLEMPLSTSHVYVAGEAGSGREALVRELLTEFSGTRPPPPDWVLLHNFQEPDRPKAISLPPGQGASLVKSMNQFIHTALREIPRIFESEDYEKRRNDALNEIRKEKKKKLDHLRDIAKSRQVSIEATPTGFVSIPLLNGKPVPSEEFEKLAEPIKKDIQNRAQEIQDIIRASLRELRKLNHQEEETLKKLDQQTARFALGSLFDELKENYQHHPELLQHFDEIQDDILEHLQDIRTPDEEESDLVRALTASHAAPSRRPKLDRYRANLLVDRSRGTGAPVIFEKTPTYYNLFGRIEYHATLGALVTGLMDVRPGSAHLANGGYLIIDALDLLKNFHSWETLKRTLKSGELQIQNLSDQFTMTPVASLRPETIPLQLRVVLIGTRLLYQLLFHLDEDFKNLFELKAEFDPEMDWNDENVTALAQFISSCVRKHSLKPFNRSAIGRLVEHAARLRSNQKKLCTRLQEIETLLAESGIAASNARHQEVGAQDVEEAIEKRIYRSNLFESRLHEWISEGTLLIDTQGEKTAQVNGIAILDSGDYSFGKPTRITASVSLGRGGLKSIERESKLSGRIHSKGFLILSGYLRAKYAREYPLALAATLTFEQSYDEIEGDSASSTELYALISALAEVPIRQGIAVTGSCNQQGQVQAVGGINEKIEGFFSVCEILGLNGNQGVMIPASNVPHLMLRKKVRSAVTEQRFHIWAVTDVDQGLELLTGMPPSHIHDRAQQKLKSYADRIRLLQNPLLP